MAVIGNRQGSIGIEKREWDLQTVTASDYTLEITLSQEQIVKCRQEMDANYFMRYDSDGLRIKLYLTQKIEEILKEHSGKDGGKVADINFAYHNSVLLDKLRTRGEFIKYGQWKEMNELNRNLTAMLKEEDPHTGTNNLELWTTPKCAFVSIENEEFYNILAEIETEGEKGKITLFEGRSKVAEAPEPTNVIWENRDFDRTRRWGRMILVIIAVCVVLFITFLATVKAKAMTNELIGKYDESINCSEMSHMYQKDQLSQLAADEWVDYYTKGGAEMERMISPTLSCFCTGEYNSVGDDAAQTEYTSSSGEKIKTCSEIFSDRATVALINQGVAFLIVGVNFVLKVILVDLIKSLRLKTVTKETNYTMITIFVGQFINTAVLIVLNNASFKDFDGGNGPLSLIFFVGTETDFSVNWYRTVGDTIMKTMKGQALWPLIEFAMFWSIMNFQRFADRGFTSNSYQSKSPSVQAYIDLYAGPEYLIHYRYAMILLQISVAFCYGCAMPPLYAIACIAFLILYINERLLVCYYYREPPAFDEKMTMLTLDLVKYVPYIMLPMAFWQLGNRQIFESIVTEIEFKSDVKLSQHNISTAMSHMNPLHMTYNSGPLWLLIFIFLWAIFCWATGRNEESEDEDEEGMLVEGLEEYYVALKDDDKASLIGSEDSFSYEYGVKTFSDDQLYKLKQSGTADKEKIIMGVATYRILDNLAYQQALQYEPIVRQADGTSCRANVVRVSTQEDSTDSKPINEPACLDVTYLAINLAYVPEDKKKTFNFDTSNGKTIFS